MTEAHLARLLNAVPFLQEIEQLAYAMSAQAEHLGPRRSAERIGIRAADLILAITTVVNQER